MIRIKEDNKRLTIVGFLFIICGVCVVGGRCLYNLFLDKEEDIKIQEFYEEQEKIDTNIIQDQVVNDAKTNQKKDNINYVAVIKIPKIKVEKGLCEKGSYCNDVSRNIQILNESDYPDKVNGNLILAGHSGNGRVAYFKNLYKLVNDDEVSVFYNGKEYKYKVVNMYDIEKTGTANIIRNADKNTLTLITCRHNTNKQIIVICELVN